MNTDYSNEQMEDYGFGSHPSVQLAADAGLYDAAEELDSVEWTSGVKWTK
jgi:hypothetical protein